MLENLPDKYQKNKYKDLHRPALQEMIIENKLPLKADLDTRRDRT